MIQANEQTLDRAIRLPRRQDRGFSYIMVLAAVVVTGIMAEVATTLTSHQVRADREAELLFRGIAYQKAIESYYLAGEAVKQLPRTLEDLVEDPRFPKKHHIRMLYPDPMGTDDKKEWTLIHGLDGGISGVASRGKLEPLKQANFPPKYEIFVGAESYADWIFEFTPPLPPPKAPVQPNAPGQPVGPPVLKTN